VRQVGQLPRIIAWCTVNKTLYPTRSTSLLHALCNKCSQFLLYASCLSNCYLKIPSTYEQKHLYTYVGSVTQTSPMWKRPRNKCVCVCVYVCVCAWQHTDILKMAMFFVYCVVFHEDGGSDRHRIMPECKLTM